MKEKFKKVIYVLTVLCCIFMFLHILLVGRVAIWNIVCNIPTFLFPLMPILFLILLLFLEKKRKKLLIFILINGISFSIGIFQFDGNFVKKQNTNIKHQEEIKVFNWNTCFWDQNKNSNEFYQFLVDQNADVYVLQEYEYFTRDSEKNYREEELFPVCSFIKGFPKECVMIDKKNEIEYYFPGYFIATINQFAYISKYPILDISMDESEQFAKAKIDIGGQETMFYNVHILLHIEPSNPFKKEFLENINKRFLARKIGFMNLLLELENEDTDYIVSGDFNSTKAMGMLNDFYIDNIDAVQYDDSIIPLSFSYNNIKLWRFDYVFINKKNNIYISNHELIDNNDLSDHNPVLFSIYRK